MGKTNGKSEQERLDIEHELPPAEETQGGEPLRETAPAAPQDEVEKLTRQRDELLDRLARLQAEFENSRKRAAKEQQEYRDYALADAIRALLPVLDSFDLALVTNTAEKSEFRSGIELINKQMHDALGKLGLRPIPAKGEPFDPRLHEAIEVVDTDEAPDHQVIDELQRGYKLKDRLLRPAMVRVARNSHS